MDDYAIIVCVIIIMNGLYLYGRTHKCADVKEDIRKLQKKCLYIKDMPEDVRKL